MKTLYTDPFDFTEEEYYGPVFYNRRRDERGRLVPHDLYFIYDPDCPDLAGWVPTDDNRLNPANWKFCSRYGDEGYQYHSGSVVMILLNKSDAFRDWMIHVGMVVEEGNSDREWFRFKYIQEERE